MPGTQPALEDLDRLALGILPRQFVISAEHASNRIPAAYRNLGLTRRQLHLHIAWDPGVRIIARACAKALGCACHEGRYSRLLVDLNRSLHHPKLMARSSFSIAIPGNRDLSREERARRIRLYYMPLREAVLADMQQIIRAHGQCIHLSIHSFTPAVDGVLCQTDIGILYDPRRRRERHLAANLIKQIAAQGFHVRRNYPYRGVNDGHTTHLRTRFPEPSYAGLEVEVNQGILQTERDTRHAARKIAAAVQSLVGGKYEPCGGGGM